jgi:hypothetical protein
LGLLPAAAVLLLIALVFLFVPPVHQSDAYHHFADQRTLFGIPNFWNVVTNLPFLAVAIYGLRALRSKFTQSWERAAYAVVLGGAALVAAGSGYYHWHPTSDTLVWDRLPMTLVFMAVFALILADRAGMTTGRRLLLPLLAIGVASIVCWRVTGDLRLYGIVQYLPVLAIPLLLWRLPPRYTHAYWIWGMCAFYLTAKILELGDASIGRVLITGGHPWKHVAAAGALLCFCEWVLRRSIDNTCRPSVL